MWLYRNAEFRAEDVQDNAGFVYVIERLDNGRRYIGCKFFNRRISRPPLKGKTRRRRSVQASNWLEYFGSNKELIRDVEVLGADNFRREIVVLCRTRNETKYEEIKLQLALDVLHHPDKYYNEYVGCRIHRKHLTPITN